MICALCSETFWCRYMKLQFLQFLKIIYIDTWNSLKKFVFEKRYTKFGLLEIIGVLLVTQSQKTLKPPKTCFNFLFIYGVKFWILKNKVRYRTYLTVLLIYFCSKSIIIEIQLHPTCKIIVFFLFIQSIKRKVRLSDKLAKTFSTTLKL